MCRTTNMIHNTSTSRKTGAGSSDTHFPGKLHDMMAYVEKESLQSVISWVENGRAFMIHDPVKLVNILKLFFGQTQYRSFRRQLNHWHFERVLHGPNRGAFEHPFFIRGRKTLCRQRSRHSFEVAAPKRLRMGSQAIIADHNSHAQQQQQQQQQKSSALSPNTSTSSSSLELPLTKMGRNQATSRMADDMNKQFLSTLFQMNSDIFDNNDNNSNHRNFLEDGDIVPFEGRRFHFLDIGLHDMKW